MEKARRRQVPAFGEWNYCHGNDEPPAERYAPEPEDRSDVWFKYSPPPHKPAPKKTRSDVAREKQGGARGRRKAAAWRAPRPEPPPRPGWCGRSTRTCTRCLRRSSPPAGTGQDGRGACGWSAWASTRASP
ncbi:hypothetical protein CFC21_098837, partial [Triticum aestivum]